MRGATRYTADEPVHGLLHARLVLAAEAHGRIVSIDGEAALALPGVVAVLTADDLPIADGVGGRLGQPLARSEVVFAGQPVAMVIAEDEVAATDGVDAVLVEIDPLPAALDVEAAMVSGAPLALVDSRADAAEGDAAAHGGGGGSEAATDEELSSNVSGSQRLTAGDVDAGLAGADARVTAQLRTSWVYQAYLEPQAATAWLEPNGELVVSSSTQSAFYLRKQLATGFGLPLERVRARPAPLGGAFGGKIDVIDPLAAAAALCLRRPVRLALTRVEDFAATNPAPGQRVEVEAGAAADGRFAAVRARVVVDHGATDDFGLESLAATLAAGPYRWPARDLRAYGVRTNRVGSGAYRAPTAPPAAFAIETVVDELATALGLDPIELRLANVIREGDEGPDGKPFPVFGAAECLERLREHPLWRGRGDLPADEGVGVAVGWWPGGLEPAAAACRLDSDGGLTIITGSVDMSGTQTGLQAIAAEAFGLPPDRVRVVAADTAHAPYAGVSGGSKITYTVGRAVQGAAEEARERLLDVAAAELEIAPEDLEVVDGEVRPLGSPERGVSVAELAAKVLSFANVYAPVEGHGRVVQPSRAPGAAAHLSHVRVDRETGGVTLLGHVIAQDVGRALNPALVEDQMLGGVAQGLGWALLEELAFDESGQLRNGSFVEYAIPTIGTVPPIECEIVEVPAPEGPFGAKGVGEPPVIGVPAAVANAIAAAVGVRLRELPMTSERVWRALQDLP